MKILAVGAHTDDVELYCGGTLLRLIDEGHEVRLIVCTNGISQQKKRLSEEKEAHRFMGVKKAYFLGLQSGRLTHGLQLITKIDEVIKKYRPDFVFSHSARDHHQDHIAVAKSVKSVNRNWNFNWLTYASYDLRASFQCNLFVNIDKYFVKKLELLKIFKSQKDKWYFAPHIILARSIGTNVGKYVEGFKIEFLSV